MKALQAIRHVANLKRISLYRLSIEMGKSKQYMGTVLAKNSTPSAENLAKMLDVCGYALCAIPYSDVPNSAILINDKDADEEQSDSLEGEKRMFSSLFDWEMSDQTLHEGEELYRIDTGNPMDAIYFTASAGTPPDEIEDYAAFAMRKRFGTRGDSMVKSVEKIDAGDDSDE